MLGVGLFYEAKLVAGLEACDGEEVIEDSDGSLAVGERMIDGGFGGFAIGAVAGGDADGAVFGIDGKAVVGRDVIRRGGSG